MRQSRGFRKPLGCFAPLAMTENGAAPLFQPDPHAGGMALRIFH